MKAKEAAAAINAKYAAVDTGESWTEEQYKDAINAVVKDCRGMIMDEFNRVAEERRKNSKGKVSNFVVVGIEAQMLDWIKSMCARLRIRYLNGENLSNMLCNELRKIGDDAGLEAFRQLVKSGVHDLESMAFHRYQMGTLEVLRDLQS